ncbi:hypothetical protein BDU57DRAFT_523020 [Ampelomyces quisqualis]|uniref:Uncharacterized protein n=1 Tax=Ampelomyces quisqualis TaxID=50730 RepID=A0A6A5QAU2_AMPQU|nr:hypothetical protein BDU57DRAFT_523020 [Ampelomyces quisqualis]
MFSSPQIIFFATLLPTAVFGATSRNESDPFQLYVYGEDLGGLPLVYSENYAYAMSPNISFPDDSNADVVQFVNGTDNMWIGSPSTKNTNWNNVTLFVPTADDDVTSVGFLASNDTQGNSSVKTTGFSWYGQTAVRIEQDGTVNTKFTALRLSNGAFQIYWNDSSLGQIPVTLRSKAPGNLLNTTA